MRVSLLKDWLHRRAEQRGAYSLRRRLIGSVLGVSVLVWAISLGLVVHVAWRETSEVFDDSLEEGARLALVLGAALEKQGALRGLDAQPAREAEKLALYYQIVGADGHVLRRAEGAPSRPFSIELQLRSGYRNVRADGETWRVYLLRADGLNFQVQIGQPWDERLELLEEMAEALLWPALVLLAMLACFCWWVIRRLLQPIERTAQRIAAKTPADLDPVTTTQEPRELLPIVRAFNLVLGRLNRALQTERRFTADAAHELRTPLAALRMRIQLLQRVRTDSSDAIALQPLRDDVDRCTALVESLLALARIEPERPQSLHLEIIDLAALFDAVAQGIAAERGRTVSIDCRASTLRAHPTLLQSALRNIVDNALKYGAPGGRVVIESLHHGDRIRVAVRDDGPGVAPADRERLGERFFRVLGSGVTGSGLGLSIVAHIAALHGATLSFEGGLDGCGLGVVLDFPAEPAAS
jgi:two-component system sensor histidine kinase QseC